ncbi:MAG TPA: aldolase/citrate lyase family protein [Caldimonas sp.]|jgi:4-hydroxy-2-oxoheptanedioate aldolase|nr:aldolase/citrate lyase family protein [Caldimonas sp.]HEX2539595.1 aldolase/citrate lyase family protein [Caldimonas sp.]
MELPRNPFKAAMSRRQAQIGLWLGMSNAYVAELLATCGFDWLLVDGEHSPNDVRSTLAQLQAIEPYPTHAIVRTVDDNPAGIKQVLDIGALTVLVPMVHTAEQAGRVVAATRYAPRGVRGLASALARASRWNGVERYAERADSEICVLVQVESVEGLANLAAIAGTDGVDGVFFGPADLSASMGHLGRPGHPDVLAAIDAGIATVLRAGKAPGILVTEADLARAYLAAGALFVAVGLDTTLLAGAARALAASFKTRPA